MATAQFIDIAGIQKGDAAAFARLFEQNRDKLLALAYRLTASQADAEDVVQDAFVSSWRHHDQFQGQAKPSTWLYRVTFNAALMRLRTRRRKGASSLDSLPTGHAEATVHQALTDLDRGVPDAESTVTRAGARQAVREALGTLRDADRDLVRLRYEDELSTEEIAEALGLSTSAVKTRLHRARQALKATVDADARCA